MNDWITKKKKALGQQAGKTKSGQAYASQWITKKKSEWVTKKPKKKPTVGNSSKSEWITKKSKWIQKKPKKKN